MVKKLKAVDLEFSETEWTKIKALAAFCKRTPARLAKDLILAGMLQEEIAEAQRQGVL